MTSEATQPDVGPFGRGWRQLHAAGWHPIPLPPGTKWPPPKGVTGADGVPYSFPDLVALEETHSDWNLGARFPKDVVGLDWDVRKGVAGFRALTEGVDLSDAPVIENGRGDGSGTYLWRLMPDQDEASLADSVEGVDVIRFGHRYNVAPPSVHPDDPSRVYFVEGYQGMPPVPDLPWMPPKLWDRLPKQSVHEPGTGDHRCLTEGRPCRVVRAKTDAILAGSWSDRHSTMSRSQGALLRLGEDGHQGVREALEEVKRAFIEAVGPDRPRRILEHEWASALEGAVSKIGGSADQGLGCGDGICGSDGLDDILGPAESRERPSGPSPNKGPGTQPARQTATGFIQGKRILPVNIAKAIMEDTPLRVDPLDDMLWGYHRGVWKPLPNNSLIRTFLVANIGNYFTVGAMETVAQTAKGMAGQIDPNERDSRYLNCLNGMVDWRTGELLEHDPGYLSTIQLGAEYQPDATCPVIDAWLAEVLPADLLEPDDQGRVFIDEVLGYLLLNGNPFHKAVLLIGSGRNGKGTFLRLVKALMGGDANVSSVTLHDLVDNRFRAADMYGKLANIAGDLDGKWLESSAMFKMVTGGDLITAEHKFGKPFQFTPQAVPVFSANAVFGTPDTSAGYFARWLNIEFPNSFVGREDRSLDARLAAPSELSGLLNRAIRGIRPVMEHGNFTVPASVGAAKEAFERASDPVRAFLTDCTAASPGNSMNRADLYDLYALWADDEGIHTPLPREKFYQRAVSAGAVARKTNGVRCFVDIIPTKGQQLGKLVDLPSVDDLEGLI